MFCVVSYLTFCAAASICVARLLPYMSLTWNTENPCIIDVSEIHDYDNDYDFNNNRIHSQRQTRDANENGEDMFIQREDM